MGSFLCILGYFVKVKVYYDFFGGGGAGGEVARISKIILGTPDMPNFVVDAWTEAYVVRKNRVPPPPPGRNAGVSSV